MPPKYKARKRTSEAEGYDSDGGFVEDAPKSKKAKTTKDAPSKEMQKDDDGNEFWELSAKRRVTLSNFRNTQFVNIREYYEKDGKTLPGKKGISLSMEQFNAVIELLPHIENCLSAKGETVARPNYSEVNSALASSSPTNKNVEEDDDESDGADEEAPAPEIQKTSSKLDKFKYSKKDHELTNDEED